jgi:acyl carrier protein
MDELLEILNEVKPGVDFENDTDLIGHGVLDSITMVTLVMELNDAFDIEITPVDIVPENFKTVQTIYDMVQRLSDD